MPTGTHAAQKEDPLIGAKLGNYTVKHWIGQGGMGVVYLAEQPDIGKAVAIKVLKADVASEPENLKQLKDEARTVNAIRHRGIIDIFGFGSLPDGREYIVMEYLEGEPLDVYLARRKRLRPHEVVKILDEVLSALGAAHKAGVVHRDLKPGNIFVAMQSDGTEYVKVLDFGLAKRSQRPYGSAAQTAFRPVGTPEYMAPEQARGESVSPRTDLYSVGIIAFELLTGDIPFNAPSLVELLMKQVQEPPPLLSALEPSVPPALEALVLELLAKQPSARPASAEVVRRRLKQLERFLKEAETWVGQKAALKGPPPPANEPTMEETRTQAPGPGAPSPTTIFQMDEAPSPRVPEPLVPGARGPKPTDEATDKANRPPSPTDPLPPAREIARPPSVEPTRIGQPPPEASPTGRQDFRIAATVSTRPLPIRRVIAIAAILGTLGGIAVLYFTGRLAALNDVPAPPPPDPEAVAPAPPTPPEPVKIQAQPERAPTEVKEPTPKETVRSPPPQRSTRPLRAEGTQARVAKNVSAPKIEEAPPPPDAQTVARMRRRIDDLLVTCSEFAPQAFLKSWRAKLDGNPSAMDVWDVEKKVEAFKCK